ncbi:hypothetical protein ACS0TY_032910 [Phlomoides rotata]
MLLQILNFGVLPFLNNANPKKSQFSKRCSAVRCFSDQACNNIPLHDVAGILQNKVLVSAAVSGAIGQLTKPFTSCLLYGKKFDLKAAFHAGGFPSTHSSATVATATSLALERGFSDAIFGLAVVYAALTMYDAQGVRREVGTHARVLNKVMPRITSQSTSYDTNDVVNSYSRESSSNLENVDPVFSEEHTTFQGKPTTSSILLETQPISSFIKSSNVLSNESESVASALKESIGHTEIEVAAGALLGFVVSLAVSSYL